MYLELAKLVGEENAIVMYREYRGFQLNMPMRLVSSQHIRHIIEVEYDGTNGAEIARFYGYTERHIRRLIAEVKDKNQIKVEGRENGTI
ncbi:Mor transcription activator family protein [Carnobacterium maltaromaticum]|uniref:Mor transcription activator family protein n=1 Tax=Carnobacterium maltaromaticum TaxID=2751 RepID=UPI002F404D8E